MRTLSKLFAALILTGLLATVTIASEAPLKTYTIKADYADVLQEADDAIVNSGLTIDFRGNISDMLDRTSKDLGATMRVYKNADFMQFCSASLTRNMMEADPANMGVCPYIVFVYETVKNPGTITVGFRRPIGAPGEASKKALDKIEALLESIVKEAAGQ